MPPLAESQAVPSSGVIAGQLSLSNMGVFVRHRQRYNDAQAAVLRRMKAAKHHNLRPQFREKTCTLKMLREAFTPPVIV
jgi:hypothetical protein